MLSISNTESKKQLLTDAVTWNYYQFIRAPLFTGLERSMYPWEPHSTPCVQHSSVSHLLSFTARCEDCINFKASFFYKLFFTFPHSAAKCELAVLRECLAMLLVHKSASRQCTNKNSVVKTARNGFTTHITVSNYTM